MTDVLMCEDCQAKCCKHPKNNFDTLEYPGSKIKIIKISKEPCSKLNLKTNQCTIYNTRYLECRTYPFMIDLNFDMFIATSCPSYSRIIKLLQENDQETIDYLLVKYNILINMPEYAKILHNNRVKEYTSVIRINIKKFESSSNVKISW